MRARAIWVALDAVEAAGIDTAPAFEGLSIDAVSVRRASRIAWDDFAVVFERLEILCGGPDSFDRIGELHFHKGWPELRELAGAFITPKRLARMITEVIAPLVFSTIDSRFEDLGGNRALIRNRLEAGLRPCETFFRSSAATLRGMPRNLGLGPAHVIEQHSGTHGDYLITFPPPRKGSIPKLQAVGHALNRVMRSFVLGGEVEQTPSVEGPPADPGDLEAKLARAREVWGATPRQVDVLRILAVGKTNKEIAEALACAENTVELHVTQLFKRARATSRTELVAKFWSTL